MIHVHLNQIANRTSTHKKKVIHRLDGLLIQCLVESIHF